jgi:hypothetical protein
MSGKVEINRISDTEFTIGGNKTVLSGNNLIHVIAQGEQTDEIAIAQKELITELFHQDDGKYTFLIDLNKCGKSSPLARSIWNDLGANERVHKTAIFGMHPVARVLASFVLGLSNKNNPRFFWTEEESRKWLAE